MWYYDPFIVLPLTFGFIGGFSFACGAWAAKKRKRLLTKVFAAVSAAFLSAISFTLVFGWLLRNHETMEEFNKWIGTMFS